MIVAGLCRITVDMYYWLLIVRHWKKITRYVREGNGFQSTTLKSNTWLLLHRLPGSGRFYPHTLDLVILTCVLTILSGSPNISKWFWKNVVRRLQYHIFIVIFLSSLDTWYKKQFNLWQPCWRLLTNFRGQFKKNHDLKQRTVKQRHFRW